MAYNSTAGMTSNASTHFGASNFPPRVQQHDTGSISGGLGVFTYRSSHTHVEAEVAGFFTDGLRHGLKRGAVVLNICDSTAGSSAATLHIVSGSTGAVAASDTAGSSAWNQAYNFSVSAATT